MSKILDKLNLTNGKMYLYLHDIFNNRKDTYFNFLSRIIKGRTVYKEANLPNQASTNDFKKLEQNNWVKDGKIIDIEYKLNQHGFRSKNFDEILDKDVIIGIGCSITYGTGLHLEQTWVHKLAQEMKCEYVNLSVPGCSTSISSFYCTEYILEKFKNVKGVFLYTPPPNRLELISFTDIDEAQYPIEEQDVASQPLLSNDYLDTWNQRTLTQTDKKIICGIEHTSFLNYVKDQKLLEYKCKSINVPFHVIDGNTFWYTPLVLANQSNYTKARDLMHDGPELHTDISTEFFNLYNKDK
jgi:hypothetical protein